MAGYTVPNRTPFEVPPMKLPFELPIIPPQYQVFVLVGLVLSVGLALIAQVMNGLALRFQACPACQHSMPRNTPKCPMCGASQP